jgi:exopolysaccharide biosynthesis polyprenyl glycosylphosphotransferase
MLKERARLIANGLLSIDLLAVAAAFFASYWVRDSLLPWLGLTSRFLYPLSQYLPLLPLALGLWGILLSRSGAYRSHRVISLMNEAWSVIKTSALALVLLVLVVYGMRLDERLLGDQLSRLWLALFALLATLFVLAHRTLIRLTSRYIRARGLNYRNILVVGTGPGAQSILRTVEEHRHWGYQVVGVVRGSSANGQTTTELDGHSVLGTVDELTDIVNRHVVDEVIFAVSRADLDRLETFLLALEEQGVLVRVALDLFPRTRARAQLDDLDGTPLLTFSTAPSNPLLLGVKRATDLVLTAVLLLLSLPAMGFIALLIKATSSGDVLFRQVRCGLNGRLFTLYKFRTMVADAEQRRGALEHLNEMSGPVFKAREDPRVTRLGRLLRRYSLDELPQLWNVLTGSMSLVGPRPPIPDEVARYERWQRRRLSMRPGLTCLWQVNGRNDLDFEEWIELDLQYIDSWSPFLDLKILLQTIPVVLSGRGAS